MATYRALAASRSTVCHSPVSKDKKNRAKTAGGPGQPNADDAVPDFNDPKWTPEKIKEWAIKNNQYESRY